MKSVNLSYSAFLSICAAKGLKIQYSEDADRYFLFAIEESISWETVIIKGSSDSDDFEATYKPTANAKLIPIVQNTPFSANQVVFSGEGIFATVPAGTTTDIDFKVTYNALLNGGIMQTIGEEIGDYFSAHVVDKDNVLGYGAGAVLNTWIVKWYALSEDTHMNLTTPQAGSIPANLYLRIKYTSTGTTDVKVIVNYKLNKAS